MEGEFNEIDSKNSWGLVFQSIRSKSNNYSYTCKDARRNDNKNLNRYRDVNPYDHTRVKLKRGDKDYINASFVQVPAANRAYILTQGPLSTTTNHFWLMVWEQETKAIVMLNRIIEKNTIKCHQYWPVGKEEGGENEMLFSSVGLKVTFMKEKKHPNYTIRNLLLTDLESNENRVVLHFHYTTWPDFGVPESPAAFLTFLKAVRDSGALDQNVGPAVIHCSAGIGRSGTFCLVDSCLVLIEESKNMDSVNIQEMLLELRRHRMGLIQTPDQLRFSYLAIIEGAKQILNPTLIPLDVPSDKKDKEITVNGIEHAPDGTVVSSDDEKDMSEHRLNRLKRTSESDNPGGNEEDSRTEEHSAKSQGSQEDTTELRRRMRKERIERTAQIVQRMKQKQQSSEAWSRRKSILKKVSIGLALVVGTGVLLYRFYNSNTKA